MTTTTDALAELEVRAGASDKDREAWLAERMSGITATEIRELYLRKITVAQLVDLKLGRRKDTFTGNKYTAWGNTREPIIAAEIEKAYGIAPESRVFHAADNPRFLASPDGVGLWRGELVVSEIKTGKRDMTVGSVPYEKAGYHVQKTWSMRVTGARKALYVFELHDDDWQERGGEWPEPQPIDLFPYAVWVDYDEVLAKELETIAIGFLVALDAARAGEVPQYDEDLDTLAVNYLRGLEEENAGKALKEAHWNLLKESLRAQHDELSQESPLARITWRAAGSKTVVENVDVKTVDEAAAKAEAPMTWAHLELCRVELEDAARALADAEQVWAGVVAKHTTTSVEAQSRVEPVKESLRVTSVKPKKETK